MKTIPIGVFKLWEEAHLPVYGSSNAACFDLKASLQEGTEVSVYNLTNLKSNRKVDSDGEIIIYYGERMLVPTGLIFDLPSGHSMRIHPRSGLSLKNGVVVANCEGVVDSDYVQQTFVMLHNISDVPFHIKDGDRIAQGEVVVDTQTSFVLIDEQPLEKTNRTGGFGSTGV